VCYYCLLRNEESRAKVESQRSEADETKQDAYYFSEEYVVCFVATFPNDDDEGFDL